jgi:CubicO group peptidase (beta-lactamase class C family)
MKAFRIHFSTMLLFLGWALLLASAQAQAGAEATPEGMQAALERLERFAEETLEATGVPGAAIAVVYRDEVVYLRGFGVREAGGDEPVTEDTVFQLASMSKPIASTIVAALVGDGALTWDDHAIDHYPDLRLYDPWVTAEVTIRDFFSHRSGLYGGAGNDLEELGFERDEILRRLRYLRPVGDFRASYAYSNFGMTVGGVAAARAAGMTWEDAAETRLYESLGMSATSSRHDDFVAQPNRAHLHILVDGEWTPELTRDAEAQSPAGGVSSSARDLAQWVRLQLGGGTHEGSEVVDEAALAQTHLPHMVSGPDPFTGAPRFYGLGWSIAYDDAGRVRLNHAGAFSVGARTLVSLIPSEELGIVVLTNAFPTGVPEAIADTFFDLVLAGEPQQDWLAAWGGLYDALAASFAAGAAEYAEPPEEPSPALPASAYVGTYTNDYVGDIEVEERDGALTLLLGPQRRAFALEHWDRDVFLYYPALETPDVPSGVIFTIGPDGRAAGVAIEDLNTIGQGTLTRVMDEPG